MDKYRRKEYLKKYNKEYKRKNAEFLRKKAKEKSKERNDYMKEYRIKNTEKIKEIEKRYRIKNKEILKESSDKWRENNKETVKKWKKDYYEKNKEKILSKNRENYYKNIDKYRKTKNEYVKNRMKEDSLFKLKFNIRCLIRNSMKRKFTEKSKKTIEILGCDFEIFKKHIEEQFNENMNWNNYGTYWEIDHIIPVSSSKTEEELYKLNHYTNFQPLYWAENLSKNDNY
jgi:hypothetical protein